MQCSMTCKTFRKDENIVGASTIEGNEDLLLVTMYDKKSKQILIKLWCFTSDEYIKKWSYGPVGNKQVAAVALSLDSYVIAIQHNYCQFSSSIPIKLQPLPLVPKAHTISNDPTVKNKNKKKSIMAN
eukprot:TRINITY_DN11088_c0_g1_i1.p1 TRINITY_DN11088_c0_g1~~TRINITY_DN11088_c0_g1_i1.p1  ORF type:complete len:127 (-),score=9.07 TRINITY_DN11088_c0_g1_i1:31-411(-)